MINAMNKTMEVIGVLCAMLIALTVVVGPVIVLVKILM